MTNNEDRENADNIFLAQQKIENKLMALMSSRLCTPWCLFRCASWHISEDKVLSTPAYFFTPGFKTSGKP